MDPARLSPAAFPSRGRRRPPWQVVVKAAPGPSLPDPRWQALQLIAGWLRGEEAIP